MGEISMIFQSKVQKQNHSTAGAFVQLMEDLRVTKGALDRAQSNFEQVNDPALVDCYIYELKAAQMRYQFLLRRVKQYGV